MLVGEARDPAIACHGSCRGGSRFIPCTVMVWRNHAFGLSPFRLKNVRDARLILLAARSDFQRLVPTVDSKRVALREYLIFDENMRDILLETDILNITNVVRKLVRGMDKPWKPFLKNSRQA